MFLPGVRKNSIKYITWAIRKLASPMMNMLPFRRVNSRIISPINEKKRPATIKNWIPFIDGLAFIAKMIIKTGMTDAFNIKERVNDDWPSRTMNNMTMIIYIRDKIFVFIRF